MDGINESLIEFNEKHLIIKEELKWYLLEYKEDIVNSMFSIDGNNVGVIIIYSTHENRYLVDFNEKNEWKYGQTLGPLLPGVSIQGLGRGIFIECQFGNVYVNKGLVLEQKDLRFFINNPAKYMDTIIYSLNTKIVDKHYKIKILNHFETMLQTDPLELEIDAFIEENPFILEYGLHLTNLYHQTVLKNLEENFEQDLKPDVIGWYNKEKRWAIVDYKRYDKKLVKKAGRARSGLFAQVSDLEYQLNDYLNYFYRSKNQTQYIKDEYGIHIVYPIGFGIIGNVKSEDNEAFLKATYDLKRNINIIPYNNLLDECWRVINLS